MKHFITAAAATLFSVSLSVSAADIYRELGQGNPDLNAWAAGGGVYAGIQPGVGDSIDRYHGFSDGNPDLFQAGERMSSGTGNSSANGRVVYTGPGQTF